MRPECDWPQMLHALSCCMAWICLLLAGLLEIGWAVGLKHTQGFTRLWPSVSTGLCMAASSPCSRSR
jgi:hypothetical protein